MKRILSIMLSIILAVSCTSFTANAELLEELVEFEVDSSGVLQHYNGNGGDIVIPSAVKKIGNFVFAKNDAITSVTIPSSVEEIEYAAFLGCENLTSVTIKNGCKKIGSGAFASCTALKSITLPNSATELEDALFEGCTSLTSVTFPKGITFIPDSTFSACTALTSYTVPSGVTSMGTLVFFGCTALKSVTFSKEMTSIGDACFLECNSLEKVTVPEGMYLQMINYPLPDGTSISIADGSNPTVPTVPTVPSKPTTPSTPGPVSPVSPADPAAPTETEKGFKKSGSYGAAFAYNDVATNAWYYNNVKNAYEYSLMYGKTEKNFVPDDTMTVAEALTIACRLYCIYNGLEEVKNSETGSWYDSFVAFAVEKGIISDQDFSDYNTPVTRAQMAKIFVSTLPEEWLTQINSVDSIPDMNSSDPYTSFVLTLYRAGICTGSDSQHNYKPSTNIKRSEVAAIISRLADKDLRVAVSF